MSGPEFGADPEFRKISRSYNLTTLTDLDFDTICTLHYCLHFSAIAIQCI